MTQILFYAFIYLFAAVAAVLVSKRFGLGSVQGDLMAGIASGSILGLVGKEVKSIRQVAGLGVMMLLFQGRAATPMRALADMREPELPKYATKKLRKNAAD